MEEDIVNYYISKDIHFGVRSDENNETVYMKNNQVLKTEDNESITDYEFKLLIKKEVSRFIYPYENTVILAGAGASIVNNDGGIPDKSYGHTVNMLAQVVDEILEENEDLFSINELCDLCKYNIPIKETKKFEYDKIEEHYNHEFILEDFLSKVLSYEEFMDENETKNKYKLTKDKILEVIKDKTSYSFDKNIHNHGTLIKIFSDMIKTPSRLSIVTTNYDTLFEEAAESLNFTVMDGFSFTSKPSFDVDLFNWFLVKPILNVNSDNVEYKKNIINLLKIHGSLTRKQEGGKIIRCDKENNENPIMIFPSSNKYYHSYENPYFELFSKFQELLKTPNTLLITTGFSFADNHIAKMITQAIKSNPSLTILATDYSIDEKDKSPNWKELIGLMNSGYHIAFLKGTVADGLIDYFGEVQYGD